MNKKLFVLIFIIIFSLTACSKKEQDIEEKQLVGIDEKIYQCIENELNKYILNKQDKIIDIPLTEIKSVNAEKIEYFKGGYSNNKKDNMYLIVYPVNGTYEADVMDKFNEYFGDKFTIYQLFESPSIPTIYIHIQDNNVSIKDITSKCVTKLSDRKGKSIASKTLKKLNSTDKIVIKSGENVLGEVKDKNKINKILNAIASSKQYGDAFLCDSPAFDFIMYDVNKIINTIYVYHDGKRLYPSSSNSGCSYYTVSDEIDLRNIIEDETNYIFYNIMDYTSPCDTALELIYQNNNNSYYLNCIKSDKVMIKFLIENKVMKLKYALDNNYISAEKVANEYPNILIKK